MPKTSETLQTLVTQYTLEEEKAGNGNDSAATRARKTLMEIIKACKTGRDEIQAARKTTA